MDPFLDFEEADGFFDLNSDDTQARRVLSLAVEFMNARGPVPTSTIDRYYPDLSPESRNRAFHRDRESLALCGIIVERVSMPDGTTMWKVDERHSFVEGSTLSEMEAFILDVACLPLVNDPEFTFRDELRIALAKIDHAFSGSQVAKVSATSTRDDRDLATLRSCMTKGCAARITYTRVDGETSTRVIAPYGFFGLRGKNYMVAPRVDQNGKPEPDSMRTYLIDRVGSAKELDRIRFEVPEDFDIADWRKLPFQMGPTVCTCEFLVPDGMLGELRRESLGQGELDPCQAGHLWRVEASNVRDAAAWAIAYGIRPLAPEELVGAWRSALEEVTRRG